MDEVQTGACSALSWENKLTTKAVLIIPSKSVGTGKPCIIEVEDASHKDGARIQLWDTDRSCGRWYFEPVNDQPSVYRIRNQESKKYLGTKSLGNAVKCVQLSEDSICSRFYVVRHQDAHDRYVIMPVGDIDYRIECEDGNLGNNTAIQLYETTLRRTQWILRE